MTGAPPAYLLPPQPAAASSKSKSKSKCANTPGIDEGEKAAATQQILEIEFAHVEHAVLSASSGTPGRVEVRLVLFRAPLLDSVEVERESGVDQDEIRFEIEGSERGKVEQVLKDRSLVS